MQYGKLHIRQLGRQNYETVWHAMQEYTDNRDSESADEIWAVEHPPVFTQGQAGKAEHILMPGDIPVIQVDRGGQVTYHGPGQLVVYPLLDIKRLKIGVRQLVNTIEQSIVDMLKEYDVEAYPKADAPGVYVNEAKVASLGLRIRKGCSFHGLALNVNMDMEPFHRINPCGYAGLQMVQCCDLGGPQSVQEAGDKLIQNLGRLLDYKQQVHHQGLAEVNE
ncbi:lipoyl(octanoyl) transferase LipB [Shewanella sp. 202IG2-18]|uniref:lipoyl(octanoyl) transferase LipB n=1 Tax=Parashewanella hymeniacidonis TaxID=2807618 RepID=UPI001961382E|nr:lipoyl(octanoyl) transferase LipB [Parashewanella hymeniacidonis]MBM7070519.1 lipoyl(octanoyl) transferase LipB [Parashewanella hymeniacidonis]